MSIYQGSSVFNTGFFTPARSEGRINVQRPLESTSQHKPLDENLAEANSVEVLIEKDEQLEKMDDLLRGIASQRNSLVENFWNLNCSKDMRNELCRTYDNLDLTLQYSLSLVNSDPENTNTILYDNYRQVLSNLEGYDFKSVRLEGLLDRAKYYVALSQKVERRDQLPRFVTQVVHNITMQKHERYGVKSSYYSKLMREWRSWFPKNSR